MIYTKKKTIDKCASITIPSTGKEGHTKKNGKCFCPFVCRRSKKHKKNLVALKIEKSPIESRSPWPTGSKTASEHLGYKTSMKTQRLPQARQRKSDEHFYRS